MTAKQRQYALFAILAGSLVVVMVKVLGIGDPAESDPEPSNQSSVPGSPSAVAAAPIVDVGLDRLRAGREGLQPAERNPFRFRAKPLPPPPPTRQVIRAPQPAAPAVPTGPPPPPPIPLKYIGFAEPEVTTSGRRETSVTPRIGVFSDGRGLVINAKEGDILEGRYRVLRIGTDSADLVYLDGRGRQTIRLSGQ